MPSNPSFYSTPTVTPAAPLAGCFLQKVQQGDQPDGFVYQGRSAVPQIAEATVSGSFNGTRDLGIIYDGAHFIVNNKANLAAWITGLNAIALFPTLATASNPAGSTVRITSVDSAEHTITAYNPDDPDLALGSFTVTQDAVPAPDIKPGMGVVFVDYLRTVEAPRPASTAGDFAGVVLRESLLSDETLIGLGEAIDGPRAVVDGQHVRTLDKGRVTLLAATGATITAGAAVYLGRAGSEAGYFYAEQDGDTSRLAIPNATWIQAGTGDATVERGFWAMLK